jgi:hypothetical protein
MKVQACNRIVSWVWISILFVSLPAQGEVPAKTPEKPGQQLAERLHKRSRDVDPFGCAMNPTTKAALLVEAPPLPKEQPTGTSLQIALQALNVNGVNPAAKTVLIGAHRLRVGENFVFRHNETDIRLALSEVSLGAMTITDLKTGEKVVHKLNIAPSFQSRQEGSARTPIRPLQGPLTIR